MQLQQNETEKKLGAWKSEHMKSTCARAYVCVSVCISTSKNYHTSLGHFGYRGTQ